jgi:hypothetical protein
LTGYSEKDQPFGVQHPVDPESIGFVFEHHPVPPVGHGGIGRGGQPVQPAWHPDDDRPSQGRLWTRNRRAQHICPVVAVPGIDADELKTIQAFEAANQIKKSGVIGLQFYRKTGGQMAGV